MGIIDRLGLGKARADMLAGGTAILSPWQDPSGMESAVTAEIFGFDDSKLPISRAQAIQVPAVSKARNLLIATIGRFPLVALDKAARLPTQPTFLYRTNSGISPQERMSWTIDDCIFHGYSLWLVERGTDGRILDAARCPMKRWKITNGNILVDEKTIDESQVILFNPPFEGLLNVGKTTLRGARDTERAWTKRMESPAYMVELDVTDDTNLTQSEVDDWEASWLKKHTSDSPSLGVTPMGMTMHTHEGSLGAADLFLESRNAIRTDVGSFLNIRASMLDGTAGIDSLTYSTTQGERNSFYEFDLPFWTAPIEWRLSMDDVVPRGQRVRFDKYEQYAAVPNPTGTPEED